MRCGPTRPGTAGASCSPRGIRMPEARTIRPGTGRTRTASRWSWWPPALQLGDRGVAQHQALRAVRGLELHLDLRLLPLRGDLGDGAHAEGVVGDPVAHDELRQLLGRGRLPARAEAGALDVAAPAADAAAEGGAAATAGALAAVAPSAVAAAPVAAAESCPAQGGAGTRHVEHALGHLVEEAAGRHELGLAPQGPHLGPGEEELLAGAGDAHVGQAPLLLELLRIAQGAVVGEGAVLHAGEEHDRELEALGRVQGHEGDELILLPRDLVRIGHARDLLQEAV